MYEYPFSENKPKAIELFAGAGGFALGLEAAGFQHILLNEMDKNCCATLQTNRPEWPVLQADIATVDFTPYQNKVDVVVGGFPCQAFSMAGKKKGFNDKRGAVFFEYARAVREIKPKLFIAENVKGLQYHRQGKTLKTMLALLRVGGYKIVKPQVLSAVYFNVPQKRERIFIAGMRDDLEGEFSFPTPSNITYTIADVLKAGKLFSSDVPASSGTKYSDAKIKILSQVPEGGYWRDLPIETQKIYLGTKYKKGSNTQVARRLSWNKPSYTLLTSPNSKIMERCHPEETRPLTIREYARIQTFPDDWQFAGSMTSQYRQIGNAVPVNLAKAIGQAARDFLQSLSAQNI